MDLSQVQVDKYLSEYDLLSKEDLQKCAARADDNRLLFEHFISDLQDCRKYEKLHGVIGVRTQPLLHVLSASARSEGGELAIYGKMYAEYYDGEYLVKHELFECEKDAPQIVGTNGVLPLKGPDFECDSYYGCMPLQSRIIVKLFDQTGKEFADECFELDDEIEDDSYEAVRSSEQGVLTLRYIVIPHGVSCRIKIQVYPRHFAEEERPFDVNGRIVVKYANTYGNYSSEECILFDKQGQEFERVLIDTYELDLSRCWVALPAYSTLVVDMDLSIFGTDQKIVGTAKLHPEQGWTDSDTIVVDDYIVIVDAMWWYPEFFLLPNATKPDVEGEETDVEEGDEPFDDSDVEEEETDVEEEDESFDDSDVEGEETDVDESFNDPSPYPSYALEIFSVFIGREKPTEVARVYGSIEVLLGGNTICSIFKSDDKNALKLESDMKFIPVLDGSRVFDEDLWLEMKVDIKDIDSSLAIKGYVDWDARAFDTGSWFKKMLCSVIRGQSGFVALHFAFFPKAVGASIKVVLNFKKGWIDVNPRICGSIIAQYSCFDYKSKYDRDYYRSVLFGRSGDDSVQLGADHAIPLSRSVVVVPSYSSLVLDVDLSFGDVAEKVSRVEEIRIGASVKTVETSDFTLRVEVDWHKIG